MRILSLFLLALLKSYAYGQAKVCFMVYQQADTSNIEPAIIEDLVELTYSDGVTSPNMTTWVYHDGRNFDGSGQSQWDPIDNIWTADGSQLVSDQRVTKFTGSRYFTYDHTLGKMVVDTTLSGEQNSDDPEVMFEFFSYAMANCLFHGAEEFFVAFSSHGAGYAGFGGDDHPGARKLGAISSNAMIAATLQSVLDFVDGAPETYDVIGFDACLMMSLGSIDDYAAITKYYMASEAVEPGHGWNFETINAPSSALALAIDFVFDFAYTKQGAEHRTPKTLAVVNTERYVRFEEAFNTLMLEITFLLSSAVDGNFNSHLHRARSSATAFSSYDDISGTKYNSALDIGSFLDILDSDCWPTPNTPFADALTAARDTYEAQFVVFAAGPGTPESSGMAVQWPHKAEYLTDPGYWGSVPVDYAAASNFTLPLMLDTYFNSDVPETIGDTCQKSLISNVEPEFEGQLLLSPSFSETDDFIIVQSEIALATAYVSTTYGLDYSAVVKSALQSSSDSSGGSGRSLMKKKLKDTVHALSGRAPKSPSVSRRNPSAKPTQRRVQEESDDFFIVHGGNMIGLYCDSQYTAEWDQSFLVLADSSNADTIDATATVVYATRNSKYSISIPVVIFEKENNLTNGSLYLLTEQEAVDQFQGYFGYLTVSLNNVTLAPENNLALFLSGGDFITEIATNDTVVFAPVIYTDIYLSGYSQYDLAGGFDGNSIIEWGPDHNITALTMGADVFLEEDPTSELTIDMMAYNLFEESASDIFYYQVNENSSSYYPATNSIRCGPTSDETAETVVAKTASDDDATSENTEAALEAAFHSETSANSNATKTGAPNDDDSNLGTSSSEELEDTILSNGVEVFGDGLPLMESSAVTKADGARFAAITTVITIFLYR